MTCISHQKIDYFLRCCSFACNVKAVSHTFQELSKCYLSNCPVFKYKNTYSHSTNIQFVTYLATSESLGTPKKLCQITKIHHCPLPTPTRHLNTPPMTHRLPPSPTIPHRLPPSPTMPPPSPHRPHRPPPSPTVPHWHIQNIIQTLRFLSGRCFTFIWFVSWTF